ncbi:hypothetical protein BGW38_007395, partial [Lunasporangiospora selenospora]
MSAYSLERAQPFQPTLSPSPSPPPPQQQHHQSHQPSTSTSSSHLIHPLLSTHHTPMQQSPTPPPQQQQLEEEEEEDDDDDEEEEEEEEEDDDDYEEEDEEEEQQQQLLQQQQQLDTPSIHKGRTRPDPNSDAASSSSASATVSASDAATMKARRKYNRKHGQQHQTQEHKQREQDNVLRDSPHSMLTSSPYSMSVSTASVPSTIQDYRGYPSPLPLLPPVDVEVHQVASDSEGCLSAVSHCSAQYSSSASIAPIRRGKVFKKPTRQHTLPASMPYSTSSSPSSSPVAAGRTGILAPAPGSILVLPMTRPSSPSLFSGHCTPVSSYCSSLATSRSTSPIRGSRRLLSKQQLAAVDNCEEGQSSQSGQSGQLGQLGQSSLDCATPRQADQSSHNGDFWKGKERQRTLSNRSDVTLSPMVVSSPTMGNDVQTPLTALATKPPMTPPSPRTRSKKKRRQTKKKNRSMSNQVIQRPVVSVGEYEGHVDADDSGEDEEGAGFRSPVPSMASSLVPSLAPSPVCIKAPEHAPQLDSDLGKDAFSIPSIVSSPTAEDDDAPQTPPPFISLG